MAGGRVPMPTSDERPSARQRGYTVRWEKAARRFLKRHPTCAQFGKDAKCIGIAKCVDHIIPHKGDLRLFWDKRNWQGLCVGCQRAVKGAKKSAGGCQRHADTLAVRRPREGVSIKHDKAGTTGGDRRQRNREDFIRSF